MGKAEDRAFERCPKSENVTKEMRNEIRRAIFTEGYHQAEKDLELTNEDVYEIWRIYNEVCEEGQIFGFDETSEEVLKRFKAQKEK